MNAVASQIVPTAVSMRTRTTNNVSLKADFDVILEKTSQKPETEPNPDAAVKSRSESVQGDVNKSVDKQNTKNDLENTNQVEQPKVEKSDSEAEKVSAEMDKPENTSEDEVNLDEEQLLEKLAEVFGISKEVLSLMLEKFNMNIQDLTKPEGFQDFVMETLSITGATELLLDSEKFEQFKALQQIVQGYADQINTDDENTLAVMQNVGEDASAEETLPQAVAMPVNGRESSENSVESKGTITFEDLRSQNKHSGESNNEFSDKQQDNMSNTEYANILNQGVGDKTIKSDFGIGSIKQNLESMVAAQEINDQIIQQVKVTFSDEITEMTMQLKPEHLGKIAFTVATENGKLTGSFMAETAAAKEAIETNMIQLKAQLNEQGIKVEEIEVTIGNTDAFLQNRNSNNQPDQSSQQRRRKIASIEALESIEQQIQILKNELSNMENGIDLHSVEFSA